MQKILLVIELQAIILLALKKHLMKLCIFETSHENMSLRYFSLLYTVSLLSDRGVSSKIAVKESTFLLMLRDSALFHRRQISFHIWYLEYVEAGSKGYSYHMFKNMKISSTYICIVTATSLWMITGHCSCMLAWSNPVSTTGIFRFSLTMDDRKSSLLKIFLLLNTLQWVWYCTITIRNYAEVEDLEFFFHFWYLILCQSDIKRVKSINWLCNQCSY